MSKPMVELQALSRDFPSGSEVVHALSAVDLRVERGEMIAVKGRSGSGKTTLLNLIGGLDRPTSGRALVDGADVSAMRENELIRLRRHKVAFIFQAFGLIPILSAAENVEVPLVGLGERANHRPYELSGGEQQRVAIARALANRPGLLLADEPTGQLDSGTGRTIMALLRSIVRSEGVTAVVATHDPMMIDVADRVVEIADGRIQAGHIPVG